MSRNWDNGLLRFVSVNKYMPQMNKLLLAISTLF